MHAGMLRFADEKMSKSLGNLVLVRDLLASYPGDAIRHYLISHHYRDEIDVRREWGGGVCPRHRAAAPGVPRGGGDRAPGAGPGRPGHA